MDTYIKFSDCYTKLGLSSLGSSDEKVIKEIISSISSAEGGCKIHFKKLDDKAYSSLTSVFDNVEPYGKESYIVDIKNDITIYYTAPITRLYGLYAVKRHYTTKGIQYGVIYNTPKVEFRCFRSYLPGKKTLQSFKKFIDMLIAFGHNAIMLEIGGAMEYKRHPEISEGWVEYCKIFEEFNGKTEYVQRIMKYPKNALHPDNGEGEYLTYEELGEIVDYCRERDFEIIPEVPCLCHVDYILYNHPELAEYPNDFLPNNACPSNEDYIKIEMDILDEIIEVFKPKRINICHDEAYVLGICPKCKDKPANKLFANHIIRLHDYLIDKNVKTMVWGDGILPFDHGGKESYHRRFPYEGKNVDVFGKTYKVRMFKYYSVEEWNELLKTEPDAEGWHVPAKACYELLPKDIEVINWMWSLYDDADSMLNDNGFYNVYGNFLATGIKGLNKRIKSGVKGFMFSNWGRTDFEALQRTNSLFAVGFNAFAAWSSEYDENKLKENIFLAADYVYKYINYDVLMRKHLKIVHTTNAIIHHDKFLDGYVIIKDDYHIGDYKVTFNDGTSQNIPIHWGHNIGNSNISWDNKQSDSDISLDHGGYCAKYLFEPIGISKPVTFKDKTFYEFVIPIDDDVSLVTLKAKKGFDIKLQETKMVNVQ